MLPSENWIAWSLRILSHYIITQNTTIALSTKFFPYKEAPHWILIGFPEWENTCLFTNFEWIHFICANLNTDVSKRFKKEYRKYRRLYNKIQILTTHQKCGLLLANAGELTYMNICFNVCISYCKLHFSIYQVNNSCNLSTQKHLHFSSN